MIDDDLDVFYDTDDFAVRCTVVASGVQFAGILGTVDDERFGGQAMAGVHVLQFPTEAADPRKGAEITTQKGTAQAEHWEVLRSPERVVDGRESVVYLTAKVV
jgi:hypothetical protein